MGEFSWVADPASGIRQRFVEANGLKFELAEAGDAKATKFAILLHGFPELNFSWRHQMPELAAQGWRVWAPICAVTAPLRDQKACRPIGWIN